MTQRRVIFVQEYVRRGNASAAYRKAFPRSKGWKPAVVHQKASELLANGEVLERVAELRARADQSAVATREEVLGILTRVVRACVTDVIRADGAVDLRKLKKARQEVGEVTAEDTPAGRRVKVKFRDAIAAADRLAKLQGWDQPARLDVTSGGEKLRTEIVIVPRAGGPADG